MGRTLAATLATLALAGLAVAWLGTGRGGPQPAPGHPPVGAAPPAPTGSWAPEPGPADPGPLPASLRGSDVDGALVLDARGRFRPTPSALRLFDHFLAARGEESTARILARIDAEIAARLPAPAAAEARALLDDYLAFRQAARRLHAEGLAREDLETRVQRVRELRREHFGAEVARALFAEEEALERASLELARIERLPELSESERAARREAVEATLPEPMRAARARATLPVRLLEAETRARAAGADERELRRIRESYVGWEAAERLEALERRRAVWRERIEAWRLERDLLLSDPETDAAALEALRALHFGEPERARVQALDRRERPEIAAR